MTTQHVYGKSRHFGLWLAVGSFAVILVLAVVLAQLTSDTHSDRGKQLVVYCAAGIRLPVEEAAKAYREEYGVEIRLDYGSSGELEGKIQLDTESSTPRCDLYIPADDSFARRARTKGLVRESMPLAKFQLALGVKPGNPKSIRSLHDLFRNDVSFLICNKEAGVGKRTKETLEPAGLWQRVEAAAKAQKPRVTDASGDVRDVDQIDAAIVWNTTAHQFGLDTVHVAELAKGVSTITAAVTHTSEHATAALRFARYLAAPGEGQALFEKHKFARIDGDVWAETPELVLFSGGVNRNAVEKTVAEFMDREGCFITTKFAGCGTLIQAIEAAGPIGLPDVFLTCDKSYMAMVQDRFSDSIDVSTTPMMIVVRKDSDKNIRTLRDLAREGVDVAITDPTKSALGALTVELLKDVGVYEEVIAKVRTAPSAHELVLMMEGNEQKLDAVVAYDANCQNLSDPLQAIPIDHPRARAIQDVASSRTTDYPHLVQRLIEAILSDRSRQRFTTTGFSWLADKNES